MIMPLIHVIKHDIFEHMKTGTWSDVLNTKY